MASDDLKLVRAGGKKRRCGELEETMCRTEKELCEVRLVKAKIYSRSTEIKKQIATLKQELEECEKVEEKLASPIEKREEKLASLLKKQMIVEKLACEPTVWIALTLNEFEELDDLDDGKVYETCGGDEDMIIPAKMYKSFYDDDGDDSCSVEWDECKVTLPNGKKISPVEHLWGNRVRKYLVSWPSDCGVNFEFVHPELNSSVQKGDDSQGPNTTCCGCELDDDVECDGDKDGMSYRSNITVPLVYIRKKSKTLSKGV